MSVGHVRHRAVAGGAAASDYYVNLLLSLSLRDDQLTAACQHRLAARGRQPVPTARRGAGGRDPAAPAGRAGDRGFRPASRDSFYQLGLRFWVVPERVQIDTTYGNRIGRGDQGALVLDWSALAVASVSLLSHVAQLPEEPQRQ